jgi:hypothetical protein
MKYLVLIFILLVIVAGCKKDDKTQPVDQIKEIMKINFTNDFIPDPFKVVVFISSPDGKLYADTSFTENGQHSVMSEFPTDTIPSSFMVTIVKYDLYWHNLLIQMNTYQDVTPGEWTIAGIDKDTIGQSTVTLNSIPEHSGLILYSNQGYNNFTTSTNPQTCRIYTTPDDFYVKMNTKDAGQRFKWLSGFATGNQYTLDLSSMEVPDSMTVTFPFAAGYFEARLWGFADENYELSKAFMFDLILASLQPQDKVSLHYPPGRYSNHRTNLMIRESFLINTVYYSNTIGEIPASFSQIDAAIIRVQQLGKLITLQASGQYDASRCKLYFASQANEIFEWYIYSPSGQDNIITPDISPILSQIFPSVDTADFQLKNIELIDLHYLSSYQEMLDALFNNQAPRNIEQLNTSSVVWLED